ncbi:MAG: hypothetical protein ACE5JD_12145, partial [Candidatus Methylomirabilia bacterium]
MEKGITDRMYWSGWFFATAMTGAVTGFMLGHSLVLGPFLSWMLASGKGELLSQTYPVFAVSSGRPGLYAFYIISGLQTIAALAFIVLSVMRRRKVLAATIAGLASPLWQAVHFVSGFSKLEGDVLRSVSAVSPELSEKFVAWNVPIHFFYTATLVLALLILLSLPFSELKKHG